MLRASRVEVRESKLTTTGRRLLLPWQVFMASGAVIHTCHITTPSLANGEASLS